MADKKTPATEPADRKEAVRLLASELWLELATKGAQQWEPHGLAVFVFDFADAFIAEGERRQQEEPAEQVAGSINSGAA